MKALTLYPLWATLIALEGKRWETRSWQASYRGPLAITASAKLSDDDRACYDQEPFYGILAAAGYPRIEDIPRGCVVCTALVTEIHPAMEVVKQLSDMERAFGYYAPGRFAWKLEGIDRLDPTVPCRGNRMLWELDLKGARKELEGAARGQGELLI